MITTLPYSLADGLLWCSWEPPLSISGVRLGEQGGVRIFQLSPAAPLEAGSVWSRAVVNYRGPYSIPRA